MKWLDPVVKSKHAKLSFSKNTVFVEPDEGEVMVNGAIINSKTALRDKDKIQLGMNSISIMQLIAKEAGELTGTAQKNLAGRKNITIPATGRPGIMVNSGKPSIISKIKINPKKAK
ncbi:MAG: FHA domain-containing protein [Saprospiraceae bacterium]|nr:FHA domain-containing protein [Saprospiraceae bacterium]